MESITKALKRAKENSPAFDLNGVLAQKLLNEKALAERPLVSETTRLSERTLRQNHVIAFDAEAAPTRSYDILRNQLLHHPRKGAAQIIAISSPSRKCGATVTAINLALSFARIRSQRVILMDANDDRPALRRLLGLPGEEWRQYADSTATELVAPVRVRDIQMHVLSLVTTEHEGGGALVRIDRVVSATEATVVVIDLPPIVPADKSMSYIGVSDSVVVVLAVGRTTNSEVELCKTYLGGRGGVQFTLNKCGRHGL